MDSGYSQGRTGEKAIAMLRIRTTKAHRDVPGVTDTEVMVRVTVDGPGTRINTIDGHGWHRYGEPRRISPPAAAWFGAIDERSRRSFVFAIFHEQHLYFMRSATDIVPGRSTPIFIADNDRFPLIWI